jgi:hypothetical protein
VTTATGPGVPGPVGPAPRTVTVTGLLLLDPHGFEPTHIDSVVVDDTGIGVVRRRGESPRLLPWDSVVGHAVEPWGGGVIPAWWVDPERNRPDGVTVPAPTDTAGSHSAPTVADRRLPHAGAGALISVQTRTGTYRFLRSGTDPADLAVRIDAFAVRHRGPAGLSSVTTVAPARLRRRIRRTGWDRVQPFLVVLLLVVVVAAVTLILLQSAGVVHLPFLGGGASSSPPSTGGGPGTA